MSQTVHENKSSIERQNEDRREWKRVPLSYPIRVSGQDCAGHAFSDLAVTSDVSKQGCRFDLLREVNLDSIVEVQLVSRDSGTPHDEKTSQFKVAWVSPSPRGWSIGALILTEENIWHMAFPKRVKANGS